MVLTYKQEVSEMKNQKSFVLVMFIAFAWACLQTAALGQGASQSTDAKVASIRSEGMGVRFDSSIPYTSATLTISAPDGSVYRREFKGGTSPSFALLDKAGAALGNGQYTYEIRFTTVQVRGSKESLAAPDAGGVEDENGRTNRRPSSVQSVVQSGSFAVQNGALYVGNEIEPTSRRTPITKSLGKNPQQRTPDFISGNTVNRLRNHRLSLYSMPDQVIADDLIVQGSACIGLDCVNNESFGFDTIRLKENNTRIKFDDTSTASGFPNHNWQLTANDSASGGANKFSIEEITAATVPFTITGGAPNNAIFVDSTGRVGLRTSTPVLDVHANTGNTPAIRLEQDRGGGFTPQTWDIAGNEANFFVRDVTGGSRLPFRIRPGAPTSSIDINASGNVGIGTASPSQVVDTVRSQNAASIIKMTNSNTGVSSQSVIDALSDSAEIALQTHALARTVTRYGVTVGGFAELNAVSGNGLLIGTFTNATPIIFGTNGAERLRILATGSVGIGTPTPDQVLSVNGDASKSLGGGSWQFFSDERLKNVEGRFNSGLKAVMQLQPIRYEYKADNALGLKSGQEQVGFTAQALQKVIPEAVSKNANGYLMVNNDPILWTMLNAIKEQQKEIAELKGQVQKLQAGARRHRK
jgi:Chaperone of endosialidase